jgi:Tol biopolymer transport system component
MNRVSILILLLLIMLTSFGCELGGVNKENPNPGNGTEEQISLPCFTPESGNTTYAPIEVTITTDTIGAIIKYTRDGTDPRTSPTAESYNSITPPTLSTSTTLRAYAYRSGYLDSDVATASYTRLVKNRSIVYNMEYDPFSGPSQNYYIAIRNSDGTQRATVYEDETYWVRDASISNSGKILFEGFVNLNNAGAEYGVYIINEDGSGLDRLFSSGHSSACISCNGEKIVYESQENHGTGDIFIMDVDGANQTPLTDDQPNDYFPSISADGSLISFQSNRDGQYDIYTINSDGSGLFRVTNSAIEESYISISPDGQNIVFIARDNDDHEQVYIINSDGTNLRQLTFQSGLLIGDLSESSFSNDGELIIYAIQRMDIQAGHRLDIHVMEKDGSNDYIALSFDAMDYRLMGLAMR